MSIVVVSAHDDHHKVRTTLREGAVGFIPKSATRDVMVGAFRLIFAGGIYIPPEALGPEDDARAAALPANNMGLTQRQLEVLALMMQGKSNKVICRKLNLAEATVKNHATAIFKVLKVSNRTEAAIAAGALGLELPQIGAL
jgi:DNA-binding NarL/FixJ family response regulator